MFTPKIIFAAGFLCLFIALGLVLPGIYFYTSEEKFISQTEIITCRISKIEEPKEGYAYLTFEDVTGKKPSFVYLERYDAFDNTLDYRVNEVYEINYNSASPGDSKVSNYFDLHPVSSPLLFIGAPFLCITPLIFIAVFKARKSKLNINSNVNIS